MSRRFTCCAVLFAWTLLASAASLHAAEQTISYHAQIRPIFQAHCQGCHQPAKPLGQYIMTDFQSLLTAGESAETAIVPGKPDDSYLVSQITPVDGEAQMPKGKAPLSPEQIELIRQWIAQGATNDSPASASQVYDAQHPPVYTTPPVTTSLDFSPDGKLLAIAGHHEVLIHHADGSGIVARLIGLSDRIESVAFSPDGTLLAVTGGAPARMGEVQVWNVAEQKLVSTTQVGYDTLYGASWSPDGSKIAFGCPDNSLRVIEAATGKEVLFQGSHGDWVLDTTFSVDGSHVVSVGRDQTAKLTEFETQRFVDNITSITPGALKGGLAAVETHPQRDEILVGGADGVLRTYRMQRETNRVIGDDANLVRMFPVVPGRIFDVGYSPDASLTTAVSSHNGQGYVTIFQYGVPGELPAEIKAILGKRVAERNAEETKKIDDLITEGVKTLAQHQVPGKGSYSLAFAPDGKSIAVASTDGIVRFYSAETGELQREFSAYPLTPSTTEQSAELAAWKFGSPETPKPATPPASKVVSLEVLPAQIQLNGKLDYAQILVTAVLENGDRIDATRAVTINDGSGLTSIDAFGLASPAQNGTGSLQIQLGEIKTQIPLQVSGCDQALTVDYVTHVTPILSKLGCNQGTCHGSAQGKAGFKLSLRGYDPLFDVRALVDDHASRRANTAVPDESLMILKSIGGVPHQGGQLTTADHKYYQILRGWVEQGAVLKSDSPKVVAIDVFPKNPTIQQIGSQQQIRVLATYADGTQRDVTYESFVESGNTEVATINKSGLLEAVRRGEASILARYEGSYAATTLTVMGDRTEFVWQDPPTFNHVDDLTAIKWQRLKIQPSELCTDEEFIRRVTLDLTGLPPTSEAVHAFINDQRPAQEKRDHYIDQLVGSDAYVTHMTNKWADLLQVNGKFLGREGATLYRNWIREQVAANRPYDEFVREIVTASGSNKTNPAASYYKILRTPEDTMENTTHLFLGVRFNCNKCHDHPFERWTQDQYYETAAYFAHVGLRGDP
ncbi:MAG: DUF1549 domain-containing protein, partial [Planctomycetaceae bacterium]|nr:DUF1549 domain-containing protein [Planctomycetaceae bacterium]